jgi:hypothetical protein
VWKNTFGVDDDALVSRALGDMIGLVDEARRDLTAIDFGAEAFDEPFRALESQTFLVNFNTPWNQYWGLLARMQTLGRSIASSTHAPLGTSG